MATYNGEKYIEEQIESIVAQSFSDWTLYIRDDGSDDQTIAIIKRLSKLDDRIVLLHDDEQHLGPMRSFMKLLQMVDARLYMFSDQDDFWLKDKIKISVEAYNNTSNNDSIPCIVHTDVSVVDAQLNVRVPSRWHEINLYPDELKRYEFIAQCCYTQGSTMLFNKKAKELSLPVKEYAPMHDWWVSTRCIRNGGKVVSVYTPTLFYRQHDSNVLGMSYSRNILHKLYPSQLHAVIKDNLKSYHMLKEDHYGSFMKFLFYKLYLMIHMSKLKKHYAQTIADKCNG